MLIDPNGETFNYCDNNGVCVNYSDEDFHKYIHNLLDGYKRIKGDDGAGVITFEGKQVASYTRPTVDFGSLFAEGGVKDRGLRIPATMRIVTYLSKSNYKPPTDTALEKRYVH